MKIEDWNYWIKDVDDIEGLSSVEKEKAKHAFVIVKDTFGTNPQSLLENRHPIISDLVNRAPWTRTWFVYFANALEELQQHENGQKILTKLKNSNWYHKTLLELDVAMALEKAGFNIVFYPNLEKNEKVPDLKIINKETKEEFFVEVSELGSSIQERESYETFDKIAMHIFRNARTEKGESLLYRGRVNKYLSQPNLERIISKIDTLIRNTRKSGFEELVEDNVIELAFAKSEYLNELKSWGTRRNIQEGLLGPSYDVDENYRLGVKIEREQEQLPKDILNILVIRDSPLLLSAYNSIEKTVSRIEEYVYKHDHLAMCVVMNSYISGMGEDVFKMIGDHIFSRRYSETFQRDLLILSNKFIIDKKLTLNSLSKMKQAFLEHREFLQ